MQPSQTTAAVTPQIFKVVDFCAAIKKRNTCVCVPFSFISEKQQVVVMATRRFEQKSLTPPPLELAAPISSPDHRKRKSRREGPIFRIFPHHQHFPSSSNGRNANHVFFSCRQKHVRAFATYQTFSFPSITIKRRGGRSMPSSRVIHVYFTT